MVYHIGSGTFRRPQSYCIFLNSAYSLSVFCLYIQDKIWEPHLLPPLFTEHAHHKTGRHLKTRAIRSGKFLVLFYNRIRINTSYLFEQHGERQFLLRSAGVFGAEQSVSPANITYTDRMAVVAFAVGTCTTYGTPYLHGTVKPNHKMVTDVGESAFKMPTPDIRCRYIAPIRSGTAMKHHQVYLTFARQIQRIHRCHNTFITINYLHKLIFNKLSLPTAKLRVRKSHPVPQKTKNTAAINKKPIRGIISMTLMLAIS